MEIAITTYRSFDITFDPQRGTFQTLMDGDSITEATLQGMYDRIDAIEDKRKDAARKAQHPVSVLALVEERHKKDRLLPCAILGIHAGRSVRKTLRVLADGQKTSLDIGYNDAVVVLHPDDPRAHAIKAHLQAIGVAEVNLDAAQHTYRDFKASLPTVRIPVVESKEVAVREEPAFLAAIAAAIQLTHS